MHQLPRPMPSPSGFFRIRQQPTAQRLVQKQSPEKLSPVHMAQDFGSAEDFAGLLARDQTKPVGKEVQRADERIKGKDDEAHLPV